MKPIHGIFFREFSTSYIPEILKELYRDAIYEPYLQGKMDLVMLDVGANIGLFSLYAEKYAKFIYAVEPSLEHIEVIRTMKEFNHLDKVIPVQCAISHKNGFANFYHNENTTMFSLKPEVNGKPDEMEMVVTISLDTFFDKYDIQHVDFMKIDIEGAEAEVFGSEGFDRVKDKIDVIAGEFHTWSGVNPQQFETYFSDRGFEFKWMNTTQATTFIAQRKK